MSEVEQSKKSNRLFYLALPPSVFVTVVSSFTKKCRTSTGWNRVIIEKPFERDLETSRKLINNSRIFFRILYKFVEFSTTFVKNVEICRIF